MYQIKEINPMYYSNDLTKTAEWFKYYLGWSHIFDEFDEDEKPTFGCVVKSEEDEVFKGIYLSLGTPKPVVLAAIHVDDIYALYGHINKANWEHVSDLKETTWNSLAFTVTTVDGYELFIYEEK